jgi:hypothetical protein
VARTEFQTCERCGRTVEPGNLWRLGIDAPPDGRVERAICVVCAAEVRRYLLAPSPAAGGRIGAEREAGAVQTRVARFGWSAARGLAYVGVAIGAFLLITWLVER